MDVIVSKRITWPHDTVLGGSSGQRMSYDQLTWCQLVQGFARNILEEKSQKTRENMPMISVGMGLRQHMPY